MGFYHHLYERWQDIEGNKLAIYGQAEATTYTQLNDGVQRICRVFVNLNVNPGQVIAIQLAKSSLQLQCILAGLAYGCPVLPLNPSYNSEEVEFYLNDSQATLLIAEKDTKDLSSQVTQLLASNLRSRLLETKPLPVPEPREWNELAILLYTSGTTGKPKGAMISHANILATVEGLYEAWHFEEQDKLLHVLPIFHVHGLFVAQFVALFAGCSSCWMTKFDASTCVDLLLAENITVMMAVPTLYFRLLALSGEFTFPALRLCTSGSAPLPVAVHQEFEQRFGQRILERYGMTEVGIVLSNPYQGERRPGAVGFPVSGAAFRIVDAEGKPCQVDQVGELLISGPSVIHSYLRRPEQTGKTIVDGWLRSGDLAALDRDGYYRIAGRAKDLVISGGMNIYPLEIEAVFLQHPAIAQAAGVGLPDDEWGERFVMMLMVHTPISEADLFAYAKQNLAAYKRPKQYFFVQDFPRNAMGKVQKARIRQQLTGQSSRTAVLGVALHKSPGAP